MPGGRGGCFSAPARLGVLKISEYLFKNHGTSKSNAAAIAIAIVIAIATGKQPRNRCSDISFLLVEGDHHGKQHSADRAEPKYLF